MKLLIDENISGEIIESLKYIGYDFLLLKLLIDHGNGLNGCFTVITKDRIRKRKLFI